MRHILNTSTHATKIPNVVDADGLYLWDERGKRYVDFESGVWCVSVGHKNRRVTEAMRRQVGSLMHAGFCYSSSVVDDAAADLLEVTGLSGGGRCILLCSGSEAIEVCRQIAKEVTGKRLSMTLNDSYLGAYSSVTDRLSGWHVFSWEECSRCERREECDPECEKLREIPAGVSDFVFEPGSSSGFVRFPPVGLVRAIVETVRGNGGTIIVNEVTTGVGRTGRWFGYEHYGIEPDMVAVGKGIGNGYPVSVAAIGAATVCRLQGTSFHYAQSHMNDPLGAAVARAVVAEIRDRALVDAARERGNLLRSGLEALVDGDVVRAVRGRGLMIAVDLAGAEATDVIHDRLIEAGFIVGHRGTALRIDPPLIVDAEHVTEFLDVFATVVRAPR